MFPIPKLLSGPVLRRISPEGAYIWLAASKPYFIDGEVYRIKENPQADIQDDPHQYEYLNVSTGHDMIQAGEHVYISLIKLTPKQGSFPVDQLLGYNLFFQYQGERVDLGDLNLLSDSNPHSIVYGTLKLPTFFIPGRKQTNILYGSCRKPHGEGQDTFTSADLAIQQHHLHLDQRPGSLFLMGDQIYADDIADPVFAMVTKWVKRLFGDNEDLTDIDPRLKQEPLQSSINKIHARQYISEQFCQFTSNHAHNHLMSFPEYAVKYLLHFGPQLWETSEIPAFVDLMKQDAYYFIYGENEENQDERMDEFEEHQLRYQQQLNHMESYLKALPLVRRVLANTPTYMIFDDHDITDDWNLSQEWRTAVYEAPLGRHVVANGLSAYFLFQGWGNQPDSFDNRFIDTLSKHLHSLSPDSPVYAIWIEHLWRFHSWHFTAPTKPVSLFLDTRTMRGYDLTPKPVQIGNLLEESIPPPHLIGKRGWKRINHTLYSSSWEKGDPLIIVSATPVYGIGLIETFLQDYVYPLKALGVQIRYQLDYEAWKYNHAGFSLLMDQILSWNPKPCIILSGDVHYGASVKSIVTKKNHQNLPIYQFTSSPIHNMSFSGVWGLLLRSAVWFNAYKRKRKAIYRTCDEHNRLHTGENQPPDSRSSEKWREEIHYLRTNKASLMETDNNIGLISIRNKSIQNKLLKYDGKLSKEVHYSLNPD
ncbi:hypothetical protein GCM10008986_12360 [Salinibacillus aidingensis]|uniref:PhoD-like phosphatase n=1 Tax=Salinibacillus aidingensis TaxID=237684 RepID=A0ABN1B245_9BACI